MSGYQRRGGHGGKREGAGRPPGAKDKIKRQSKRVVVRRLKGKGQELPLERLLRRMADKRETEKYRDQLAIAAAPFCHPRLSPLPTPMATFEMTDQQLEEVLRREAENARRQGDLKAARRIEETLRDDGWSRPAGEGRKPNGRT
jgi:hypothetical protein